jgi:hypothetical protein
MQRPGRPAEVDPAVWASLRGPQVRPFLENPRFLPVSAADRQRAARTQPAAQIRRVPLTDARAAHTLRDAVWPCCCDHPATLMAWPLRALASLEADCGDLALAYLEQEAAAWRTPAAFLQTGWAEVLAAIRTGRHDGTGLAAFRCDRCGRVYVASCGP